MSLAAGARVGNYLVESAIGSGGMGEVYRARDVRLNRTVALKILPATVANDADRLQRFEREAQLLAAVNHSHIAQVYGIADDGDVHAIVMELVDGDDLSERMAAGPMAPDDAFAIAEQIAAALEFAHDAGIVHRDLKPANIKIAADGSVKVLDFGLAKSLEPPRGSDPVTLANSPTMVAPAMTTGGMILGTAAYMAPEQAKGRPVDRRADIWAFGVIVFEMLTGRRLFAEETASETLAAVLSRDVDFTPLDHLPPEIVMLLRRCLERDPKRRLRDAGDARLVLEDARSTTHPPLSARTAGRPGWAAMGVAAFAGAMVGTPVAYLISARAAPAAPPAMRLDLVTPPAADPFSFALSRDGRQIVFLASDNGVPRLWLRRFDSAESRPLSNTVGASYPFWAPDGRSIGFFADGQLKRLELSASRPTVVAEAPSPRGGSWNQHGDILYGPIVGPINFAAAAPEASRVVTKVEVGDAHRAPYWLPDGSHFLYYVQSGVPERRGVYVTTLADPVGRLVIAADSAATFIPPSTLLFVKDSTLFAQPFDPDRGSVSGEPIVVAQDIASDANVSSLGAFASAEDGVIAYRTGLNDRRLAWLSPDSGKLQLIDLPFDASTTNPQLSPDGRRVAIRRQAQGNDDIHIVDLIRRVSTRLTFHAAQEAFPIWSPGADYVVFRSNRNGNFDLFTKPTNGSGDETLLLTSGDALLPTDWSGDGRFVAYYVTREKTGRDLWLLPMHGVKPGEPVRVLESPFQEALAKFSDDGRWLAYQSNEAGSFEVFVRAVHAAGPVVQISSGGGIQPRWSPDGRTLFYLTLDGRLMSARYSAGAAAFDVTGIAEVPGGRLPLMSGVFQTPYDVGPDGRLLVIALPEGEQAKPITLLLNWRPRLP